MQKLKREYEKESEEVKSILYSVQYIHMEQTIKEWKQKCNNRVSIGEHEKNKVCLDSQMTSRNNSSR